MHTHSALHHTLFFYYLINSIPFTEQVRCLIDNISVTITII